VENIVYFSLGSNIEPSLQYLKDGLHELSKKFTCQSISSVYKTQPVGDADQPFFLNLCVQYTTSINDPFEVLTIINEIETKLGRIRNPLRTKGPRVIDIDILLFNAIDIQTDRLIIPHFSMFERNFVLIPLLDILDEDKKNDYKIHDCIARNPQLIVHKLEKIRFDR